jgi:hypothetical protein
VLVLLGYIGIGIPVARYLGYPPLFGLFLA